MRWKKAGMILLLTLLVMLAGCKDKEGSSSNSTPPPTVTTSPDVAATPEEEKVKAAVVSGAESGLRVRAAASTSGEILGLVDNGTKLKLLNEEKMSDFYQVSYQGKTAYVYAEYVRVEEVLPSQLSEDAAATPTTNPENTSPTNPPAGTEATETPAPTQTPETDLTQNRDGEA